MAIHYKDSRTQETEKSGARPLLIALAIIAALFWFSPQFVGKLENALVTFIQLPKL
jgi:hypothetical protein